LQDKLKKELAKETEQNKGDIEHLESLKKHYEEREKTYAVSFFTPWLRPQYNQAILI